VTISAPADIVISKDFSGLEALNAFDNPGLNFSTIIDGLKLLSGFLGQFNQFSFLNTPIPLST